MLLVDIAQILFTWDHVTTIDGEMISLLFLQTQIELELEWKGLDSNENAQFDGKNAQFIEKKLKKLDIWAISNTHNHNLTRISILCMNIFIVTNKDVKITVVVMHSLILLKISGPLQYDHLRFAFAMFAIDLSILCNSLIPQLSCFVL